MHIYLLEYETFIQTDKLYGDSNMNEILEYMK